MRANLQAKDVMILTTEVKRNDALKTLIQGNTETIVLEE
jgi:hypothetical protein